MKKLLPVLYAMTLMVGSAVPSQAKELEGPKKRIAVSAFENKSTSYSASYGVSVGNGIAEMLATALQKTGRYIVLERNALSGVLEEQKLAKDGAVQAATGAKSNQLIGAAYIVTGAITEFGVKEGKYSAGKLGNWLPIGGDAALNTETARVALDLRFVDTTTGQVIATEKAEGSKTSRRVQTDLDKMPSFDMGTEGFDETVIGKATREAVEKAVELVNKHMEKAPWYGRVVKVEGSDVFLNTGVEDGRKTGEQFQVVRAGEMMTDPDTGEALGSQNTVQGQVRIVSILGKRLSKAEIVKGTDIKPSDIIQSGSSDVDETGTH